MPGRGKKPRTARLFYVHNCDTLFTLEVVVACLAATARCAELLLDLIETAGACNRGELAGFSDHLVHFLFEVC